MPRVRPFKDSVEFAISVHLVKGFCGLWYFLFGWVTYAVKNECRRGVYMGTFSMSDIPPAETYYVYCVFSEYTDAKGLKKLGLTIHPVHRLRQYAIGDAPGCGLDKQYNGIWKIEARSRAELREMETILHTHFADRRQETSEWFRVTFEEVAAFMNSPQKFKVQQVSFDEVKLINTKYKESMKDEEKAEYEQEDNLRKQQEAAPVKRVESLFEKFLRVILKNGSFRINQTELWVIFSRMCESSNPLNYKGIIQWPTATGKTIALLMLFVISAERSKRMGVVFRGLLVAPKNDIFNTIMKHIYLLSEFGITVCEGHNANLSSLQVPRDVSVLVTATHAGLTDENMLAILPPMTHVHYDEVHRIGGDQFFGLLKHFLGVWNTELLTGTSATPKTSNPAQHKKIAELFGEPYNILHKCDIDRAIQERWIAKPRFQITVISKSPWRQFIIRQFLQTNHRNILAKQEQGHWSQKGGKCIAYLPLKEEVREAFRLAKEEFPSDWKVYLAVEEASASAESMDDKFVEDAADGVPRILFACERYREGSDINGLEMTSILMGNTIAANILIQIIGRALRLDHVGKEGWCSIFRPSDEDTTEEDVMDNILLDIAETLGRNEILGDPKEIRKMVEVFIGTTMIREKYLSVEETVARIQALYERRAWTGRNQKERYEVIRRLNKQMNLTSRQEYYDRRLDHLNYIDDPKMYFKDQWISWYDFLGLDTSAFPQTKPDWVRVCKDMGLTAWEVYKQTCPPSLPVNPSEMYEDYTNWDKEFGIEEEIVW